MKIDFRDDKIQISDFNEMEAYKIASKVERDGIEFYNQIKEQLPAGEVKNAVTCLLTEEANHLKVFEKLFEQKRSELGDNFEEDDLLGEIDYGVFQPYKQISNLQEHIKDPKKAMQLGINIEDKSISFYQSCKDNVSSDATRKELDNIIREEIKHKEILKKIQESV